MQGELKVYELERFKACYCGLCHTIGKKYGRAARFVLSYELVFLSMLLWDCDGRLEIGNSRCMASPLRKKRYCLPNRTLGSCAGYNVILSWWKLRDAIADEPFIKSIPYRAFAALLRRAYKKASREYSDFDSIVRLSLAELAQYEKDADATLDGAADKFAKILRAVSAGVEPDSAQRPMAEILYHLGRWIYIVDACDDYNDDVSARRFNPVAAKFPPEQGEYGARGDKSDSHSTHITHSTRSAEHGLSDAGKDRIGTTLSHSNNLICSAFELLPENVWTQTVRNTIYLGMPDVCARVMSGSWPPKANNQLLEE